MALASTTCRGSTACFSGVECLRLQRAELANSRGCEIQQRIEFVATECVAFGRALHFNEGSAIVRKKPPVRAEWSSETLWTRAR